MKDSMITNNINAANQMLSITNEAEATIVIPNPKRTLSVFFDIY